MKQATRNDLTRAADKFFAGLLEDVRKPREYHPVYRDEDIANDLEATQSSIDELKIQLVDGRYDARVRYSASAIASRAGTAFEQLDPRVQFELERATAFAHLQQMELLAQSITAPGQEFLTRPLFTAPADALEGRPQDQARTLADMVEIYLDSRRREDVSQSTIAESGRALGWMNEALGADAAPATITTDDLRKVRNGFQCMDIRLQGRARSFSMRQTENRDYWIKPQTSGKYWRSVQGFFRWMEDEGYLKADPSAGIRVPRRSNIEVQSPDPFSDDEVLEILKTPLFAGRRGPGTYLKAGSYIERGSHWWAVMMGLHTGMRAGEMSQLEVTDIDFTSTPPVIHVRRESADGTVTKRTKNRSSIRDIPISSVLLALGFQAFVDLRSKAVGTRRLFPDIPLGSKSGKVSSGLSHFFSRYWPATGLWKVGRSTHVFRHTVVAKLRSQSVAEDVISALVGHSPKTQTGRYGACRRPLSELTDAIAKLDYGVDIPTLIDCLELQAAG